MEKIQQKNKSELRVKNSLKVTSTDFKATDIDPKGTSVVSPKNKTLQELLLMRSRCDRADIERRMAEGISKTLVFKKIQDAEDRTREIEEESTVGLEINVDEEAKSLKQFKKQRKQKEMGLNMKKFGKQKLGVHGMELPPFASSMSQLADSKLKTSYD